MLRTYGTLRRLMIVACIAALASVAGAFVIDGKILIDRALNSPTLTIKYSGASAAVVELRLNGESVGTRTVNSAKTSGETNFTINLSTLQEGDNEVEVRLYDKGGKLVGSEKTIITADDGTKAPVHLTAPKMGATVQGPVEIKVGFGREMRNAFVSFFIDNQFKSMTNFPPFVFIWDTAKETNGWHEVEAWVVDETSTTFKSKKLRVFIDNPGGRTERVAGAAKPAQGTPAANSVKPPTSIAHLKPVASLNSAAVVNATSSFAPSLGSLALNNKLAPRLSGNSAGLKAREEGESIATGAKLLTPTGTRIAAPKAAPPKKAAPAAVAAAKPASKPAASPLVVDNSAAVTIPVTKGQRLPSIGSYAIVFNTQVVTFDVQPRIENGVPMTPFRHLIEKAGGEVDWMHESKSVNAKADGREILVQIGDRIARINKLPVELEIAPYLERGRTIVPLSFIRDTLSVNIEFDKETGHVLITSIKK